MGADVTLENKRLISGEPVCDIYVKSSRLKGIEIRGDIIPRVIDEVPILSVAAAMADGETLIRDAGELRVKETDRISTMVTELRRIGVSLEEMSDGLRIAGGRPMFGATCSSHGDHRVAMSLAIAGLAAGSETTVEGTECINTSFPGFKDTLRSLIA
jgi:3-phosphoshikimate 1-carboxyvinyltransferase